MPVLTRPTGPDPVRYHGPMTRDARALFWSLAVLTLAGVIAGAAGVLVPATLAAADGVPRLWTDPDVLGALLFAIVVTGLAAWPSVWWVRRARDVDPDGFTESWEGGPRRQWLRLAALHSLVGPAAFLLWMTVGVGTPIDLTGFYGEQAAPSAALTCSDAAPDRVAWATGAMCRWSSSRVAPLNVAAGLALLLAFGVFVRRVRSTDVEELRTDATGFTVLGEAGELRVGWQEVASAEVVRGELSIVLKDGREVRWAGPPDRCVALLGVVRDGIHRTAADARSRSEARRVAALGR